MIGKWEEITEGLTDLCAMDFVDYIQEVLFSQGYFSANTSKLNFKSMESAAMKLLICLQDYSSYCL